MHVIKFEKSTACLILDLEGEMIDYQFINKYHFENFMTNEELEEEAQELARRNNVEFYELQTPIITRHKTTVKCYYENGDTITTDINGTFKEAENYFLDNYFNIGNVSDNIQQCIKVEEI